MHPLNRLEKTGVASDCSEWLAIFHNQGILSLAGSYKLRCWRFTRTELIRAPEMEKVHRGFWRNLDRLARRIQLWLWLRLYQDLAWGRPLDDILQDEPSVAILYCLVRQFSFRETGFQKFDQVSLGWCACNLRQLRKNAILRHLHLRFLPQQVAVNRLLWLERRLIHESDCPLFICLRFWLILKDANFESWSEFQGVRDGLRLFRR